MAEAQYESKCALCGERIAPGDEIVFDEDAEDWVHAAHHEDDEP